MKSIKNKKIENDIHFEKQNDMQMLVISKISRHVAVVNDLTFKHRETHGCIFSTVATDALVLKHQAISILSTD